MNNIQKQKSSQNETHSPGHFEKHFPEICAKIKEKPLEYGMCSSYHNQSKNSIVYARLKRDNNPENKYH